MPGFILGDGREKACHRKLVRRKQQCRTEMRRSGAAFAKLPTFSRNGGRATQCRASRATRELLAQRLRAIRKEKGLSQDEISGRMALRRSYLSRVENGQHMPTLRILEKWAHVLEVPVYQLFYGGKTLPELLCRSEPENTYEVSVNGSADRYFNKLRRLLPRLKGSYRKLLLEMAQTIYTRGRPRQLRGLSPRQRQVVPEAVTD